MFFLAPVLQFLLARLLVPWLVEAFPVLAEYRLIILMLMALQVVTGIGFVAASIMLDEKDEGVLTAIRTLPLGAHTFLVSRLLGAVLIAFIFSLAMLGGTGLSALPGPTLPAAALLLALLTPPGGPGAGGLRPQQGGRAGYFQGAEPGLIAARRLAFSQ